MDGGILMRKNGIITCSQATFGDGLAWYPCGHKQLYPGDAFSHTACNPQGLSRTVHSSISSQPLNGSPV